MGLLQSKVTNDHYIVLSYGRSKFNKHYYSFHVRSRDTVTKYLLLL